jgi:hypothetical protein
MKRNRIVRAATFLAGLIVVGMGVAFSSACRRNPDASATAIEEGPLHLISPDVMVSATGQRVEIFKPEAAVACRARGVNFRDHGGKVLGQAQIQVIFWGSQWNASARAALTNKIKKLVASPYTTKALPSRVRCPSKLGFYWDADVTPRPGASVRDEVLKLIRNGKVIAPSTNVDNAYLLIAPGAGYSGNAYGYHSWRKLSTGAFVHYGVVDNRNASQVTRTFSHELIETMTDPRFTGFYGDDDGRCGQAKCENADACPCSRTIQTNVSASYYYAPRLACVAPDGANTCKPSPQ